MAGYITLIVSILMIFVEITPIKINPISWLISRLNKPTLDKIGEIENKLFEIEKQGDLRDIGNIRSRILANDMLLVKGEIFTEDQWNCLYKDIEKWRLYHEKYSDLNGIIKITIEHIDKCYKEQHYGKDK